MLHPSPSVKTVLASSGWKPRHECYKVQKPASSNTDLATNTKCWIMMCRWLEEKALKERGSMEIITDNYEVKKSMRRFLLINIQATYHNSSLNEEPWYSTKMHREIADLSCSPKLPNSVWQSRKKIEKQLFCVTFLGLRIAVLGVHPSKVLVTWKPIHAIAG